ncbi:MAG: glutamate--cysteine ligase [Omnitrophica WOR_2 bacterium RIFCSPHIGHO2_01_FULL_48_9]|nr:MAG: glutamate--cysteine ligase [Omnitrophica WOR_2 bacterium RIFCSPHIGHO2_02_FULL_48_11]OGX30498.1 MAG: glutamate--cysteine ligase [Omnitrophica WOR_2 bacterium RIFCSPHIGHO2_01_FULL_48_9]
MPPTKTTKSYNFDFCCLEEVKTRQEKIHAWLRTYEGSKELPLYSSVDIRDAGFKLAVVDTNIFPGGFNNVCEHGLADAVGLMRQAILKRVPKCEQILIVAEEHTRNTWYLENIRILQQIIEQAGFKTKIATFLSIQPAFCESAKAVELETATGQTVKIHCFKRILENLEADREDFDLIIMNNDLTTGIPEILKNSKIPIYPSIQAGWHSRLKSHHFRHTQDLIQEFAKIVELDPWLFSCAYTVVDNVNVNEESDRKRLSEATASILENVRKKYQEHKIIEKPFVFLKADSGTYGMGVFPVEDAKDILTMNRKARNNLYKGKGGQVISRFLVQEGVPTIYNIDEKVSEVVIYQIENNVIGGFYRTNTEKTSRENLNSQGMGFKKMCPHLKKYGECGIHHDLNIFDVYRILARIAGIAAHREIIQLEAQNKMLGEMP